MGSSKKQNNDRKFSGPGPRPDNTPHKRTEAAERQAAYDALSSKEKIALLDNRLGKGVGAEKQRARIAAEAEAAKNPKPQKGEKVVKDKAEKAA